MQSIAINYHQSHKLDAFLQATFFSTQPQYCLNVSWIELQMLLRCCLINTYKHYHTEALLIFTIFLLYLGPEPRSIYVVSMRSIYSYWSWFSLWLIIKSHEYRHAFICSFTFFSYYFWMITWIKSVNYFQIAKVQPQGVAYIKLTFCQFQLDVAYKSVAY